MAIHTEHRTHGRLIEALRLLKKHAAAVWAEDEATYRSVFASPEAMQHPVRRRSNGQPTPPAPTVAGNPPSA